MCVFFQNLESEQARSELTVLLRHMKKCGEAPKPSEQPPQRFMETRLLFGVGVKSGCVQKLVSADAGLSPVEYVGVV